MRMKCIQLLTDITVRFVKVSAFKQASGDKSGKGVFGLDFDNLAIQKPDYEMAIGIETNKYLSECVSEDDKAVFHPCKIVFLYRL